MRSTKVVLPAPVLPIIPTFSPASITKEASFNASKSPVAWRKVKFLNSILPVTFSISTTPSLSTTSYFASKSSLIRFKEALPLEVISINWEIAMIGQIIELK